MIQTTEHNDWIVGDREPGEECTAFKIGKATREKIPSESKNKSSTLGERLRVDMNPVKSEEDKGHN